MCSTALSPPPQKTFHCRKPWKRVENSLIDVRAAVRKVDVGNRGPTTSNVERFLSGEDSHRFFRVRVSKVEPADLRKPTNELLVSVRVGTNYLLDRTGKHR